MVSKNIRLDKEYREAIERQIAAFRKKFGREPGPNDPIFFDPDADTPQPYPQEKLRREWSEVMDEAVRTGGIRPELAHAAKKTGFLVTESNKKELTRQQKKEWDDSVQEYLDSVSKKIPVGPRTLELRWICSPDMVILKKGDGMMSIRLKHWCMIALIIGAVIVPSLVAPLAHTGQHQGPFEPQGSKARGPDAFALFAATPGSGGDSEQKATIDTLSKSARQEIDEIVTHLMSEGQTPGMEVSIQKDGKTIYECGYGAIAKKPLPGSNVLPRPDTRFQIDSLTKIFTAFAVLRLVEQGRIDLDAPMGKYLPLPNMSWMKIPVHSYLGMITGIPDGGTTNGTYQDVIDSTAIKKTDYGLGLDFDPGSKYEYSNTNFFILGELVKAVSRQHGFMPFTKESVLEPLGMADTGFIPFGSGDLWPTPYDHGQKADPRKPNAGFSGGGFVSTMGDLEKYAIGLYNRAVLSPKSYKEMWTRTVLTSGPKKGQSINFGLGWDDVALDSNGDVERVSKNGGGWGWGSQLTFFPKAGYSVILLRNSNGAGNLSQTAIAIEDALTGLPSSAKPAISVNNVANTCGGTLYVSGSGFTAGEQVTVTVKNAPGHKAPQKLETALGTVSTGGSFSVQVPYGYVPGSGLPGCRFASSATTLVTFIVRDQSGDTASTEIYLRNCAITWGACPA